VTIPIPVETHGFGWTAAGAWTAALALIGMIVRQVGPWRKISIDAEERLRADLLGRVEKLERMQELKDARHSAERAADRHRINNLTQCLDAILLLVEQNPGRAKEAVAKVREMRAQQIIAEAAEKAAIHAAEIAHAKDDPKQPAG
jgi:hypothetical protein